MCAAGQVNGGARSLLTSASVVVVLVVVVVVLCAVDMIINIMSFQRLSSVHCRCKHAFRQIAVN